MEIDSVKAQLQHILAMHEDVNVNDDDIIYATIAMMRQAHVVAQMLLLEGRYGELQRCLELCRVTLGEAGRPPSRDVDEPRLSESRGDAVSVRVDKSGSLRSSASLHGLLSQVRVGVAGDDAAPVRRALQNLSEEDHFLFRCLRSRTEQLQRQLDVARATRSGRDTAYYIRKLVAAAAPVPDPREEEHARRMTHTGSIVVLPKLRQTSTTTTMPETSARPPTPPERGVSIGRRTKLNKWKVLHELPPLVTSSKTFFSSKAMQVARTRSTLHPTHLPTTDSVDETNENGLIEDTMARRSWRPRGGGTVERSGKRSAPQSPTAEMAGSPLTHSLRQSVLPMIELEPSDESACHYYSSGSSSSSESSSSEDEAGTAKTSEVAKASAPSAMLRSETLTRFVHHAPAFYSAPAPATEPPTTRRFGGSQSDERADLTRAWSPRHASPVSLTATSVSSLPRQGGQSPAEFASVRLTPSRTLPQSIYRSNRARLANRSALLARRGHSAARPVRRLHMSSPLATTSSATTSTQSPMERSPTTASASANATQPSIDRELTEAASSSVGSEHLALATSSSSPDLPPLRVLSADIERRHDIQPGRSEARVGLPRQPPRAPAHNYALERTAAAAAPTTKSSSSRPPEVTRTATKPTTAAILPRSSADCAARAAAVIQLATSAMRTTAKHLAEAQARGSAVLRRREAGGPVDDNSESDYQSDEEGVMSYDTGDLKPITDNAEMTVLSGLTSYPKLSPEAQAALQTLQEDYVRQKQLNVVQQRELRAKADSYNHTVQSSQEAEKATVTQDVLDWRLPDATRTRKSRRATPPQPPPIVSPLLSSFPATPMAAPRSRGTRGNPLHTEDALPSLTGLDSGSSFFAHVNISHDEPHTAAIARPQPRSALAQLISSSLCSDIERGSGREEVGWATLEGNSEKELRARSISAHLVRSVSLLTAFVPQASIVQTLYEDHHGRLVETTMTNSTPTPSAQHGSSRGTSEVAALLRAINAHDNEEGEKEKTKESVQEERMQYLMTTPYQFNATVHCIVARHQLQRTTHASNILPAQATLSTNETTADSTTRKRASHAASLAEAVTTQDMAYLPTLDELRQYRNWCALPPALLHNCLALELHATVLQRYVRRRLARRRRRYLAQRIHTEREAEVRREWAVMLLQRCIRGHLARRRAAMQRARVRAYIEQSAMAERPPVLHRATLSPSSEFDLTEPDEMGRSRHGSASTRAPVCASFTHTESMVFDFTIDTMSPSRGGSQTNVGTVRTQDSAGSRKGSTTSSTCTATAAAAAIMQSRRRSQRSPSVHPFAASLRRRASQATPVSNSDLAPRESPFQTSLLQSRRGTAAVQPLFVGDHLRNSGRHYHHNHHSQYHHRRSGTRLSFSVGPGAGTARSRRASAVTLSQPSPPPPPSLNQGSPNTVLYVKYTSNHGLSHKVSDAAGRLREVQRRLAARAIQRCYRGYRDRVLTRMQAEARTMTRLLTQRLSCKRARRALAAADLCVPPGKPFDPAARRHSCRDEDDIAYDEEQEGMLYDMEEDEGDYDNDYEDDDYDDDDDEHIEDEDDGANLRRLMRLYGAEVYERYLRRMQRACQRGDLFCPLRRVNLGELRRLRQRREDEAAAAQRAREAARLVQEEERLRRERRVLEAVLILQRVGRACQRRRGLRAHAAAAQERQRVHHRPAELLPQYARRGSLNRSVSATRHPGRSESGPQGSAESALGMEYCAEDVLAQTEAPAVIASLLRQRHPSWFETTARTERNTTTALMLQRFVHASLSTRLAFRLYLDRLASTIQRAWRAHHARLPHRCTCN